MLAASSYRASRLTVTTSRAVIALRNTGIWLAGRIAPTIMVQQLAPVVGWKPPPSAKACSHHGDEPGTA